MFQHEKFDEGASEQYLYPSMGESKIRPTRFEAIAKFELFVKNYQKNKKYAMTKTYGSRL
jgi:hypothetical protein